jgi:hypothetical protein
MNFNELMAKMRELDAPATTTEVVADVTDEGCGAMPMSNPSMNEPDAPPPRMSINLNAQGMENIEDLMKLVTKVNPDMDKPAIDMPSLPPMPSITSLPPLKMLPDMDKDPVAKIGGPGPDMMNKPDDGDDGVSRKQGDLDNDGDHDMDDHDLEKKKDKDEAFGNSLGDSEPEVKGVDDVLMKGNDFHKPKKSFSGKPYRGDNPMAAGAYESTDLRAQIRAELQQRLSEVKGAK